MILLLTHAISWTVGLFLLGICAWTDVKDRLIPNELVMAIAAIGLAQGLISAPGSVWRSLLAALVVFCALGIFSHYKIIGGGDLKLITAASLLVPPEQIGLLLVEIALAGGMLSCIYLAAHYALKRSHDPQTAAAEVESPPGGVALIIKRERERIAARAPLPYAVAVLSGVGIFSARGFVQCSYATSCLL
jgi:prepilin peptidase CpaA